jgi:cytochrome c peroxidase
MWDGRESSTQTGTQKITFATNPGDLLADLAHQSVDATLGHAQGATAPTPQQQQAIIDFEMALATAQAVDSQAGALNADGATGGSVAIRAQTIPAFFVGINDPLGGNPHLTKFTPVIFDIDLFDAWVNLPSHGDDNHDGGDDSSSRRASIVRGQALFNGKPIDIVGVAGLNDDLNATHIAGTCGTCHDSPNVGNHSVSAPLNIGVGDVDSPLDVSYLPVITLQNKTTLKIITTTDPGRALITGLWKDVGRLKGPILRGLPSRAPYFHNGSASTLADAVNFYDVRFHIGFTPQEKKDLVAFLNAL